MRAVFERHSGPITVNVVPRTLPLATDGPGNSLLWDDIFQALAELRKTENIPEDAFVCLLTKTANESNWYAGQDPKNMRNGFVHVSDFSWVTSAPSYAISAHYVMKGIFNFLLSKADQDWLHMMHLTPRGCFFDFCGDKGDFNIQLRTADICGDCLPVLQASGVSNELLVQAVSVMEETRNQARNTSQFLPTTEVFHGWPFPVAITRHKAVQASKPLLRFMLLLDHFDSLVRYLYLAHQVVADRVPELEGRPSLGWWVDALSRNRHGSEDLRSVVAIANEERVVSLRNERRGHGWMSMSEESYVADAARLQEILTRIEAEVAPFLGQYILVVPRNIELKNGNYTVTGDKLVGSHALHPSFEVSFASDPRAAGITGQNQVFITDKRMEKFRLMSPYIRMENCPECEHTRVLITDGGDQYIDTFMGHRVTLKEGNC